VFVPYAMQPDHYLDDERAPWVRGRGRARLNLQRAPQERCLR
jgi:hypothetical protein